MSVSERVTGVTSFEFKNDGGTYKKKTKRYCKTMSNLWFVITGTCTLLKGIIIRHSILECKYASKRVQIWHVKKKHWKT